jgi:hypothetical protein
VWGEGLGELHSGKLSPGRGMEGSTGLTRLQACEQGSLLQAWDSFPLLPHPCTFSCPPQKRGLPYRVLR